MKSWGVYKGEKLILGYESEQPARASAAIGNSKTYSNNYTVKPLTPQPKGGNTMTTHTVIEAAQETLIELLERNAKTGEPVLTNEQLMAIQILAQK